MSERVVIADLGMGNLRSVARALDRAAGDASRAVAITIEADPNAILSADRVVFPGQGAFRDCASALSRGFGDALREVIARGSPYLGICLGLQALFVGSDEAPGALGLGVFDGRVERLIAAPGVKVPHMGWNAVVPADCDAGPWRGAIDAVANEHLYFVHSFHAAPKDASIIAATTQHGPNRITAAVAKDNVLATQFHPEKSQAAGLALLRAFFAA